MTRVRKMLRRALWLWITALLACSNGTGVPESAARSVERNTWRSRLVLVYADLSASVPDTAWDRPLIRLAGELTPGDRLVLLPISDRAPERPLLDTVIPGNGADRVSVQLGLSTRESRRRAAVTAQALGDVLRARVRAAREGAPAPHTAIVDAVCHAVEVGQSDPNQQVVALVLSDGVEESEYTNLAHARPRVQDAIRLARTLTASGSCTAGSSWPRIRLVGLRHPTDTPALIRWWGALLRELGYPLRADDVSSHPLGSLLGTDRGALMAVRDPGQGVASSARGGRR